MLRILTISLISSLLILSCKQEKLTKKFAGSWENTKDSTNTIQITENGSNFIFKYSHKTFYNRITDEMILEADGIIPAYYDKEKDNLTIKWKKELDAVYDNNTGQLIIETWGAYKKKSK